MKKTVVGRRFVFNPAWIGKIHDENELSTKQKCKAKTTNQRLEENFHHGENNISHTLIPVEYIILFQMANMFASRASDSNDNVCSQIMLILFLLKIMDFFAVSRLDE